MGQYPVRTQPMPKEIPLEQPIMYDYTGYALTSGTKLQPFRW